MIFCTDNFYWTERWKERKEWMTMGVRDPDTTTSFIIPVRLEKKSTTGINLVLRLLSRKVLVHF